MEQEQLIKKFHLKRIGTLNDMKDLESFNKPGVWALYAKSNDKLDATWQCIQVAKTSNLQKEIDIDIQRLKAEDLTTLDKSYINQFQQDCSFTYKIYPSVQDQLYYHIRKQYEEFLFVQVEATLNGHQVADMIEVD